MTVGERLDVCRNDSDQQLLTSERHWQDYCTLRSGRTKVFVVDGGWRKQIDKRGWEHLKCGTGRGAVASPRLSQQLCLVNWEGTTGASTGQ